MIVAGKGEKGDSSFGKEEQEHCRAGDSCNYGGGIIGGRQEMKQWSRAEHNLQ